MNCLNNLLKVPLIVPGILVLPTPIGISNPYALLFPPRQEQVTMEYIPQILVAISLLFRGTDQTGATASNDISFRQSYADGDKIALIEVFANNTVKNLFHKYRAL